MAKFKPLNKMSFDEFKRDYEPRKTKGKLSPIVKRVRQTKTGQAPDIGKDKMTPEQINKLLIQRERDELNYGKQVDGPNNYRKQRIEYSKVSLHRHKRGFAI